MPDDKKQNDESINKNDFDEYLTVWKHYEDVAMHFNDLIIRLRTQSIGGIAALATIIGIISKCTSNDGAFNYNLAIIAIICLMLFWIAIWFLDLQYYSRLLEGSVNAILELEKNKDKFFKNQQITLSSNIEKAFKVKFEHEEKGQVEIKEGEKKATFLNGRTWFYGIVLLALLFLLGATIFMKCINCKAEENTTIIYPKVQNASKDSFSRCNMHVCPKSYKQGKRV